MNTKSLNNKDVFINPKDLKKYKYINLMTKSFIPLKVYKKASSASTTGSMHMSFDLQNLYELRGEKAIFLLINQNIWCGYSKEPAQ